MLEPVEYSIESSKRRVLEWTELWQYREGLYFFTSRDINIKYQQTVLGFLWTVLQPLLMIVIFTLLFGKAFNIHSHNLPHPIYVFSGLLIWNLFSTGISNASNSLVNNAIIIKKFIFPALSFRPYL